MSSSQIISIPIVLPDSIKPTFKYHIQLSVTQIESQSDTLDSIYFSELYPEDLKSGNHPQSKVVQVQRASIPRWKDEKPVTLKVRVMDATFSRAHHLKHEQAHVWKGQKVLQTVEYGTV